MSLEAATATHDWRVLILAPTRKDAEITQSLLGPAGLDGAICRTVDELTAAIEHGAAAVLITEETITARAGARLAGILGEQPRWSDLPVLVLTRPGADSAEVAEAVRTLGNVTLLERPVRVATLMSALQTAIRARTRQYQIRGYIDDRIRTEDSLRDADRRKDEFLATLGHELRNPLTPILAGLQVLKLTNISDPRGERACAVIERQIHHLVRLVNDLLELSRITRGVIDVQQDRLELGAVLRTAVETSRPLVEAAGQNLAIDVPKGPIPIVGDAVRLTQVFANLLNNASRYTDNGGHIWLKVSQSLKTVSISVRDDGIGIAPDQLSAVFEMFTQVDRSQRRAQGGLGIGLTLVRSLVSMHGGSVEARSKGVGTGTEFIVRLPLAGTAAERRHAADRFQPFPRQRILVVDDNQDAAETLSTLLAALGATVSLAHSGREALERIEVFVPDVLLLDIGMPGMDGYQVAREIRSNPSHSDLLLIALSGWGQPEDREHSRDAGFDHHLVKPPDIDRLRSLIIDHAAARRPR